MPRQCKKWAIPGGTVCYWHGGAAPQVRAKAQQRLADAMELALAMLVEAIEDGKVDPKTLVMAVEKLHKAARLERGEVTDRRAIVEERVLEKAIEELERELSAS